MVFDAPSLYARGWFAGNKLGEVDNAGVKPVQAAIVASCWLLGSVLRDAGIPDKALFCWDGERKTNKNRKPKPIGYADGMDNFKAWAIERFPEVPHVQAEAEADDLAASSAKASAAAGVVTVIITADKDLQQVASDKIKIFNLGSKSLMSVEDICRKWDIARPSHLALYLAIVGDPADGIAGVPGMGPKRFGAIYEGVRSLKLVDAAEAIADSLESQQAAHFESALRVVMLGAAAPASLGAFSMTSLPVEPWCAQAWRYVRQADASANDDDVVIEED